MSDKKQKDEKSMQKIQESPKLSPQSSQIDRITHNDNLNEEVPDSKDQYASITHIQIKSENIIQLPLNAFFPHFQSIYSYISHYFAFLDKIKNSPSPPESPNSSFINLFSGHLALKSAKGNLLDEFLMKLALDLGMAIYKMHIGNYKKKNPIDNASSSSIKDDLQNLIGNNLGKTSYILITEIHPSDINLPNFSNLIAEITSISLSKSGGLHIIIFPEDTHFTSKFDVNAFDHTFELLQPDLNSRENFLQNLFIMYNIHGPSLHYGSIAKQLEAWSFKAIHELIHYYIHLLILNSPDFKILPEKITTQVILEAISERKFFIIAPHNDNYNMEINKILKSSPNTQISEEFQSKSQLDFEDQLYQEAASEYYQDLSIILDKMMKGIILEEYERKILSECWFVLKKTPQRALESLNQAKEILNRINQDNK